MPYRFGTLILLTVLALAAAGGTAQAAKWKKPAPLRGDTKLAPERPQVGVGDDGSAVVAWTEAPFADNRSYPEKGRVRVAFRAPGKKFAKPLKMPELGAKLLDVAVGPDGTAAVLYAIYDPQCTFLCDPPLRLAVRDAGGKFKKPITVVSSAFGGQVEVDGAGVINVMWTTPSATDPRGVVAQRKPRRSFGRPVEVPGKGSIEGPTLAVNDSGDAVATWVQGRDSSVYGSYRRKASGQWSAVKPVGVAFSARAAIADNGDAVVAWATNGETRASYASARTGEFTLGEALPAQAGGLLDLAIDGDGNVLAMLARQTSAQPTFTNIVMTRSAVTGRWREQAGILTGQEEVDFAFDGLGTAYALFTRWVTGTGDPGSVSVAMQLRGRQMGRPTTLTRATTQSGVIDVSAEGNAVAAWVQDPPVGTVVSAVRE